MVKTLTAFPTNCFSREVLLAQAFWHPALKCDIVTKLGFIEEFEGLRDGGLGNWVSW